MTSLLSGRGRSFNRDRNTNKTNGLRQRVAAWSSVLVGVTFSHQLLAAWIVTDLGSLGGDYTRPYAINSSGQVVGETANVTNSGRAFLWQDGAISDLGTLGGGWSVARAINSAGQVVGYGQQADGTFAAFSWENGVMTSLAPVTGNYSRAYGINDFGEVAGWSESAFVGDASGVTLLGSFPGGGQSFAFAITSQGLVTGDAYLADGSSDYHAFSWSPGGNLLDLGTLSGGAHSTGFGVNSAGQIVGHSDTGVSTDWRAVLWSNGDLLDLGTLGGASAEAFGINSSGQIVGWADNADGNQTAFLYQNGQMLDLNHLIEPGTGWYLTEATAVNDSGQIAGVGYYNGQQRGFVLQHLPLPSSILLLGSGIALLVAGHRRSRRVRGVAA
jgi:probable HAF family extracellular repeat protein